MFRFMHQPLSAFSLSKGSGKNKFSERNGKVRTENATAESKQIELTLLDFRRVFIVVKQQETNLNFKNFL
jgi:hypothetical protein